MSDDKPIVRLLSEVMQRMHRLPSQMAKDLGISHATVIRWLAGETTPSTRSCYKLAEYSGVPLERILSVAGHMPEMNKQIPAEWPEFREYASSKYPEELDDDLITMIEYLIERRRNQRRNNIPQ